MSYVCAFFETYAAKKEKQISKLQPSITHLLTLTSTYDRGPTHRSQFLVHGGATSAKTSTLHRTGGT